MLLQFLEDFGNFTHDCLLGPHVLMYESGMCALVPPCVLAARIVACVHRRHPEKKMWLCVQHLSHYIMTMWRNALIVQAEVKNLLLKLSQTTLLFVLLLLLLLTCVQAEAQRCKQKNKERTKESAVFLKSNTTKMGKLV